MKQNGKITNIFGVAEYKLTKELPNQYEGILPK